MSSSPPSGSSVSINTTLPHPIPPPMPLLPPMTGTSPYVPPPPPPSHSSPLPPISTISNSFNTALKNESTTSVTYTDSSLESNQNEGSNSPKFKNSPKGTEGERSQPSEDSEK